MKVDTTFLAAIGISDAANFIAEAKALIDVDALGLAHTFANCERPANSFAPFLSRPIILSQSAEPFLNTNDLKLKVPFIKFKISNTSMGSWKSFTVQPIFSKSCAAAYAAPFKIAPSHLIGIQKISLIRSPRRPSSFG